MSLRLTGSIILAILAANHSQALLYANAAPAGILLQDKLKGIVGNHLQKVVTYLDKADKAVTAEDAKSAALYLDSAETQWKTFFEWNKGKFDPDHAQVVATKKRMETTRKNVAALAGKSGAKPVGSATPKKQTMSVIVEKHLAGVEGLIESMDAAVARKDADKATDILRSAEQHWKAFRDWNKGKYDPKDPRVVAAEAGMKTARTKVAALAGAAGDMAKTLSVVLTVMLENEKELQAATKTADFTLMGFDSNAREYRHIKQARKQLLKLPGEIAIVNERLLDSVIVCREFRQQIPDMDDLNKLVKDGYVAENSLKRVEAAPKNWLKRLSRTTKQSLDSAEENIANYEKKLIGISKLQQARQEYIASNAFEWGVDHADVMLQIVPAAFLELSAEGMQTFPDYVKAREAFVTRADALAVRSKKIAAAVGKVRKQIVDAELTRIDAARFPKTEYSGKKWKEAEQEISKAFAEKIRDKKLLRIAIDSPWAVRKEARWRNKTWIIGTYRYIGAYCVAKLGSGKCYVYHMSFRRTQQGDGTWSKLEQWSVGHVYEMAEKNLDK
jgi:hypothetical protein